MKAIICVGISASGKSTFAEELCADKSWVEINRDNIRFNGKEKDWTKYKFTRENEQKVSAQIDGLICYAAKLEKNIICSDTNINEGHRNQLIEKFENLGYDVEIKRFDIELREAIKRDNQRAGGVGQSVLMRQYLQMHGETYEAGDGELAYIVDIDGTVALSNPDKRGWYDWHLVGTDDVNHHVMNIVKALDSQGYSIVFLSGRDGCCELETRDWLNEHFGREYELFMRANGDMRRDSVVKKELFDQHIAGWYNVQAVIDDRPQVIKETWLPMGLNVISVGNPYIDF